ncbi:MAG: LiaF transmembrane domain-containing protein [Candidatus Acidiferrales bacterium]
MVYVNRSRTGLFVGLFIVVFGLVLLLDQEGIVSAHYVYRYFWPAIFIFFGLEFLVSCRFRGGRGLIGALMLAFGLLLLVGALGYLSVGFQTLWPVALILWGVWIVMRSFGGDRDLTNRIRNAVHDRINQHVADKVDDAANQAVGNPPGTDWRQARRQWREQRWQQRQDFAESVKSAVQDTWTGFTGRESADPEFDYMAIFGGIKQRVTVKNFRGGRLTALFGGFEVDLTRADIEGPVAVIDASALFGGGEIRVPPGWIIEIQGLAILGGYTDETHQEIADHATAKRLIVKGIAALGGVVIKN